MLLVLRSGTESGQVARVRSGAGWWTDTGTDPDQATARRRVQSRNPVSSQRSSAGRKPRLGDRGVEASHGCAGERGRLHDDPLPQLSRPEEDVVDALVDQLFGLDGGEGMGRGEGHRRRVAAAGGPCVDEDVLQWAQTGLLGRR
jgi:hypothetical protein